LAQRRVFELARDIGVTSKTILDKCRAEGIELKNHMAQLGAGLEATIREWFSGSETTTAVETTEHVDLVVEREKARKQRRRRGAAGTEPSSDEGEAKGETEAEDGEGAGAEVAVAEEAVAEAPQALEEPEAQAEAPAETVAQAPPVTEAPAPPAAAAAVAEAAPVVAQTPPPAVVEQPAVVVPAETKAAPVAQAPAPSAPPAHKPAVTHAPTAGPVGSTAPGAAKATPVTPASGKPGPVKHEPLKRPEVKPAGPQLVPRPATLKGPRVVRMEKPDFVQAPPPRRRPGEGPMQATGTSVPPRRPLGTVKPIVIEEEDEAAKNKKRSPRRRGGAGRSAAAVTSPTDVIKEWRDKDLIERDARLAAATSGGGLRRHRHGTQSGPATSPSARGGKIQVESPITVKNLSAATGIKSAQIIRKLMETGKMATINQVIDQDVATVIALEFGMELDVVRPLTAEEQLVNTLNERPKAELMSRAPVVTVLGHVDHGKTSLLDRIRKTAVAAGEAGGITQHIGAYRYDVGGKHVVFLDTPGHEAFTAMRARGANMTDVVVLVVAADDGVMPQTVESINHAKAAGVPIVVALNKVDVPNANVQRALGQLAEHGLSPREWGGTTEVIQTSAHTGLGIDSLVETLSLEAEILELKAEVDAPASGYVIEAKMDPGMGVLARLLVRSGTLKVGDVLLAGKGYGRVRAMVDSHGRAIDTAGPSTPVEVSGLAEVPDAGDKFYVAQDIDQARQVAEDRHQQDRTASLATTQAHDLQSLLTKIDAGKATELNLIIKSDVQGSVEAITGSLEKLNTAEVRVKILHTGVGGISTGDVALAEASDALIIGFNVVPDSSARTMAERSNVEIRQYRVIYDIIDDMRKALEEGLSPEVREQVQGHADVRQVFKVSRVGSIAGCFVTDGTISRNHKVRIVRHNIVIEDGRSLESLKRFKDDAREVRTGMECGLKIAGYDDIKDGDVLEFYTKIEVARKL